MNTEAKLFKIILLGDHNVEKTQLVNKYITNSSTHKYGSTIGIDFRTKLVTQDGNDYKLQLWDTSGQERFMSFSRSHYDGAHCILVCFDVTDRQSFINMEKLINDAQENDSHNAIIVIVGLENSKSMVNPVGVTFGNHNFREVSEFEGSQFASRNGFEYYEIDLDTCTGKDIHELMFAELIPQLDHRFPSDDYDEFDDYDYHYDDYQSEKSKSGESWYSPVLNFFGSFF